MADQPQATLPRQAQRIITTINETGHSIFLNSISGTPPMTNRGDGVQLAFNYSTDRFPPNLAGEADVKAYENSIANPPSKISPNGCFANLADFPPGYKSPMHRTDSLNFQVIIEGEVELILDSGETRRLLPGDMVVQRNGNHAWRNVSSSQWVRVASFSVPIAFEQ